MKELVKTLVFSLALVSCATTSGWTQEEKTKISAECNSALVGAGAMPDVAATYCGCIVPKIEEAKVAPKHPDIDNYFKSPESDGAVNECVEITKNKHGIQQKTSFRAVVNSGKDTATQTPSCDGHVYREDKTGRKKDVETYVPCKEAGAEEGNGGVRK